MPQASRSPSWSTATGRSPRSSTTRPFLKTPVSWPAVAARLSLDQASADAKAALAELRVLARGIHPQILTEAGLGAAIDSLVSRSPIEMTVDVAHDDRYSPAAVRSTV